MDKQSPAGAVQPLAWRVRGYSQFKTGAPGAWRYVDGANRPKVNNPEDCDFEPLYAAPAEVLEVLEKARQALESAAALLERCGQHLQGVEQECCGNYQPDYGGEYMGQREVVPACCMQPIDLSDHVASEMHSLRAALAEIEAMKEKTL